MAPQINAQIVERLLKPILIGENPLDIEVLWQRMYHLNRLNGYSRGFMMEAISGVDIALWDLAGKILNQPVYQLLGGAFRKRLSTYASPIPIMESMTDAIQIAEGFVRDGFRAIKVKIGYPDIRTDVELVRMIRNCVGSDIDIMLDANGKYDAFTAMTVARRLENQDILWLEEPLPAEDVDGYVALKRSVDIPLAAGECESTAYNYREWIDRRAVDVIQPNLARTGGLTAARRTAFLADAHRIPVSPHGVGAAVFLAATLHLSAAIPNFLTVEYNRRPNPLRDDMAQEGFVFADGFLQVPDGPGLGITVNPEFIELYQ
jgi:D-arabinonate dehydratase/D-galactarolactone cycloisomerase